MACKAGDSGQTGGVDWKVSEDGHTVIIINDDMMAYLVNMGAKASILANADYLNGEIVIHRFIASIPFENISG